MLKIESKTTGQDFDELPKEFRQAMPKALRGLAFDVRDALRDDMRSTFDRPKPFTLNAFRVDVQAGAEPSAVVWALPIQAGYLRNQIEGGDRDSKGFEHKLRLFGGRVALPSSGAKLDAFGNMSRGFIRKVLADVADNGKTKRFFAGTPKGGGRGEGVWARVKNNKGLVPLMRFADDAEYSDRFEMSAIAEHVVSMRWESQLLKAMKRGA